MSRYVDAGGAPLDVGDKVRSLGWDYLFEVKDIRPEGAVVIRNLAPGFEYTSTVPLRTLVKVED